MRVKPSLKLAFTVMVLMVVILLLATPAMQLLTPPKPVYRHVNPSAETERFPLPSFMSLQVIGVFDALIGGNYAAAAERLKILGVAYTPERFRFVINRFTQLMNDVASLLNDAERILDQAEALIAMGKGEEVKPLLNEASRRLAYANLTCNELKRASDELARTFSLPRGDVYAKVDELGGVIRELQWRLLRLLDVIERQGLLEETFLQIDVEPKTVWTGGSIEVDGKLYAINGSLEGRVVQIIVDGVKRAEVVTSKSGAFNLAVGLPYVYRPEVTLQARYMPKGSDGEIYKPAASNLVKVVLLYVKPTINVQTERKVLPGKSFSLKGYVEADAPIPYQSVKVSWAGACSEAALKDGVFEAMLYTPDNIRDGEYTLKVETPAWQVFAPAEASVKIMVQRLPVNVTLQAPFLVFAGLTSTLNGRIIYGGERFNATVKAFFAGQAYATNSSGEFKVDLNPPLTVLTGHQDYELRVTPSLPWYSSLTLKGSLLTINPLTFSLPAGLLSALTLKLLKERPRRLSVTRREEGFKEGEAPTPEEASYSITPELRWLIDLYWQAVAMVSGVTGIKMAPSTTLREYLKAAEPKLGNLYASFEVLTITVEKALYSPAVSLEELKSAKEAAVELKVEYVKAGF